MKERFKKYYATNPGYFSYSNPCVGKQEVKIAAELARILGGRTEVQAGYGLGRIDILSNEWLIEVKYGGSTNEKQMLGQLLCYKMSLNWTGKLGIGIINNKMPHPGIRKFCHDKNITIFFYNLNNYRWQLL